MHREHKAEAKREHQKPKIHSPVFSSEKVYLQKTKKTKVISWRFHSQCSNLFYGKYAASHMSKNVIEASGRCSRCERDPSWTPRWIGLPTNEDIMLEVLPSTAWKNTDEMRTKDLLNDTQHLKPKSGRRSREREVERRNVAMYNHWCHRWHE